jgi:homoserine kinase
MTAGPVDQSSGQFTVHVPCSTSNLGAGFDALGMALSGPALRVRVRPCAGGLRIAELRGEGAAFLPRDKTNRVLAAACQAADWAGSNSDALSAELFIDNSIPLARGLGSSAAAALAGALLVDELLSGALGTKGALAVAVAMEGHPDNVVPALRGGAQVAILDAAGVVNSCPIRVGAPLAAALFIPDQPLSTERARGVLPAQVTLADAVFNLGRAALFAAALADGRCELLGEAMKDRLHQGPRTALMPWLPDLIAAAISAGAAGAALSGAGTTVCALSTPEKVAAVTEALAARASHLGLSGRAIAVEAAVPGARIERD